MNLKHNILAFGRQRQQKEKKKEKAMEVWMSGTCG
jgi:hypothetical protein